MTRAVIACLLIGSVMAASFYSSGCQSPRSSDPAIDPAPGAGPGGWDCFYKHRMPESYCQSAECKADGTVKDFFLQRAENNGDSKGRCVNPKHWLAHMGGAVLDSDGKQTCIPSTYSTQESCTFSDNLEHMQCDAHKIHQVQIWADQWPDTLPESTPSANQDALTCINGLKLNVIPQCSVSKLYKCQKQAVDFDSTDGILDFDGNSKYAWSCTSKKRITPHRVCFHLRVSNNLDLGTTQSASDAWGDKNCEGLVPGAYRNSQQQCRCYNYDSIPVELDPYQNRPGMWCQGIALLG